MLAFKEIFAVVQMAKDGIKSKVHVRSVMQLKSALQRFLGLKAGIVVVHMVRIVIMERRAVVNLASKQMDMIVRNAAMCQRVFISYFRMSFLFGLSLQ